MKNIFFLILLNSLLLFSQKYNSLFWKITKNNKLCGHLYGTMHVSNKSAFRFSDEFMNALQQTDLVALETDPSIWLSGMLKTGILSYEREIFSSNKMNNEFYKNLFALPFPNNYIYVNALQYEPDIINGLLFRNNKEMRDYQEATYVDLFIYQSAKKLNKNVVSLEDFESSEIYSRLASLPDDEFDTIPYSEPLYSENKIEDFYKDGNLDAIDSLFHQIETRNTVRFLLYERNKIFIRSLDSLINSGKKVFAAVGAAHLPGINGMIESLRNLGYQVEPIYSINPFSTMKVRQIEKMIYKPNLKNVSVFDSVISMKSPDIFYSLFNYDDMSNSVSPDLINGAYVSALRFKTYAFHQGQTREQIVLKIDSLLYEGIGGKIIDKKFFIINEDVRLYDVISKLQNGNILHSKIFITPVNIYIIKQNSTEEYYKLIGKSIMETVKCNYKRNTAKEFTPPSGGFKIMQYHHGNYFKNFKASSGEAFEVYETIDNDRNQMIGFLRGVYSGVPDPEADSIELRKLYEGIRINWLAVDTSCIFRIENKDRTPKAYFRFRTGNKQYLSGMLTKHNNQYCFLYFLDKEPTDYFTEKFKKYFEFIDDKYIYNFRRIKDDDFHFNTTDEVSGSPEEKFNEKFKAFFRYFKNGSPRDILEKRKRKTYSLKNKIYYSPSTMQSINVVYEEYSPYEGLLPYEMKERILNIYKKNYSCSIRIIKIDSITFNPFIHFLLTDTATTEQLNIQVFVKYNRVYQLKYLTDSVGTENLWKHKFTKDFIPSDTLPFENLFKPKFDLLIQHLLSEDTANYHSALYALENDILFASSSATEWKKFINSGNFNKLPTEAKERIIANAYELPHSILIPELMNLYRKLTDSSYLQLAILRCLSMNKTKQAIAAMNTLLLEEVPVSGDSYQTEISFLNLVDSLHHVKNLLPALKKLIEIDEYKKVSASLIALMLENQIIQPKEYEDILPKLLMFGNIELKKYFASGYLKSKNFFKFIKEKNPDESMASFLDIITEDRFSNSDRIFIRNIIENKINQQEPILNYYMLLAPFHTKSPEIRKFINKVLRIQSYNLYIPVQLWALKNKIIHQDSIRFLLEGNYMLNWYTHYLVQKWDVSLRDISTPSTLSMIKNLTLSYIKKSSSYIFENHYFKDSLTLHKTLSVNFKNKKGDIYLFKSCPDGFGRYTWHYAFVPSGSDKEIHRWKVYLTNHNFKTFKKDSEIDKAIIDDFESIFLPRYYLN
jgi:uncharacterized protein YbaP (TraB family)